MPIVRNAQVSAIAYLIKIFDEQRRLARLELDVALQAENRIAIEIARFMIARTVAESAALLAMPAPRCLQ